MSKVQQAIYLATVRLHVMDLTDEIMREHWINDDAFVATILGYHEKQFTAEAVAHALVDAYRAVMKEAVGK